MDLQQLTAKASTTSGRVDDIVTFIPDTTPLFNDALVTVTSPAWLTLTDLTQDVEAAYYKWHVELVYNPAGAVGNARFGITSPAFALGRTRFLAYTSVVGAVPVLRVDGTSGFGTSQAGPVNSSPENFLAVYEGTAHFTASGQFTVRANKNTAADSNFTIKDSSFLTLQKYA